MKEPGDCRCADEREAGCVRFGYVRMLADEPDMFFYLADSLNWCGAEIYLGTRPTP